ncbi:DUF7350 domain-containing protein [Halorientalis salina]|uniref:DUF7350 domain-containing protein n=1 Tax=Halorientalis salina TaxID=2932266 RepID=UPI0010ABECC6|nr:fe2+ transport protein [Halorientalis salina]
MDRRRYLRRGVGLSVALFAGCSSPDTGSATTDSGGTTTTTTSTAGSTDDGGVYVQTFLEEMAMAGRTRAGEYEVALLFTVPHRFWTVTGEERSVVPIDDDDAVHLMAVVWDRETRTVLPGTGLSVEVNRAGRLISEEVIYPMLSQRMGFHYGGNFPLPGDDTYTVDVSVGALPENGVRTTGAFGGRFADPATGTIDLEYSPATRASVSSRDVDQGGSPGALAPMEMGVPVGRAPEASALPGESVGTARSGDARFVETLLDDPPTGVNGTGPYLAVSPRTPYNRLDIPGMGLSASLTRGDSTVADEALTRTLDPNLGYHHGTTLPATESGDRLRVRVETPPQVARHEGYERAFLEMPDMELQL